jgi:hypothetical protein
VPSARWRRLPAQQQALMALAHLRNGDTLTRLAAGFEVSVATVWRYPRGALDLLAACADDFVRRDAPGRTAGLRHRRRHADSHRPGR